MDNQQEKEGMLSPYRILDLTDDKGFFCGKLLGDLGADVIKIEPPGGDPSRNVGPFFKDIPDPEKSLYWWAYNTSKRGITLNIETSDGRNIFRRLVRTADIVLESFSPGYMDSVGLGYSALSEIKPEIIMTAITPFGQKGPYRDFKGPDIVVWSLGGQSYVTGDEDRPPCRPSFPQACLHACSQAAGGTLAALYYREHSGEGQYIDVSMQDAVVWTLNTVVQFWDLARINIPRSGTKRRIGLAVSRFAYPCKDGHVGFWVAGGFLAATSMPQMIKWMAEENMLGIFEDRKDWGFEEWSQVDASGMTPEELGAQEDTLVKFFANKTKAEIYEEALKRRIILTPSSTAKDLADNIQLDEREFYVEVEHPELGETIKYMGAPYKVTESPWRITRRAPLIGEHNQELYEGELGFFKEDMRLFKEAGTI
ncbi:MAG: CoA transferase [Dehalococcoidia bacterium]|nr:MAG: CoA transferase [Dehalococcoidia bacterium]